MGGGALFDVGCYPVQFMNALMDAEPLRVQASLSHSKPGVDGSGAALLHYPDGAAGVITFGMEIGGDRSFKVCGTRDGITACQMDMKIKGIDFTLLEKALMQARDGRMHILAKMDECIAAPKSELSTYAPRLTTVKVPVDAIGLVIGPGGKTIRQIQADSGVEINIEEDGTVTIAALSGEASDRAKNFIMALIAEAEEGATYQGRVTQVREGLGAIVEFLPKKEGLLHISEIDYERVENVSDVIQVGDVFDVKLIAVKGDGKYSLSRKALLPVPEGYVERPRHDDRGGGGYGDRCGGGV